MAGVPAESKEAEILRLAALQQGSGSRPKRPRSLIKAVKDGDLGAVRELLKGELVKQDLEKKGMWENTPLLVACSYAQSEIALALLEASADPLASNEFGVRASHYAAMENMPKVMESLLLRASSQQGTEDSEEGSPAVSELVNCPAAKLYNRHLDTYVLRTPLGSAAENGFLEMVRLLLRHDAKVDAAAPDPEEVVDGAGEDSSSGQIMVGGKTPLWLACRRSHFGVVQELLRAKAAAGAKSEKGVSPLEAACLESKSEPLVRALLEAGADVNDTAGCPLKLAVLKENHQVVERLLTNGADVHRSSGKDGDGPLHAACQGMDEHLVRLLLQRKADPDAKDKQGRSAFDVLARLGGGANDITPLEALLRKGRRAVAPGDGSADTADGTGGTGGGECPMDLD